MFTFRPLAEADLPLLVQWLRRPHVSAWWEGEPTADAVRETYLPADPGPDAARGYLGLLDGDPAAYIQVYVPAAGDPAWWPDLPGPGVRGIDQFLADGERLGQGLGTALVTDFAAALFEDPSVTEIRVDPHPDNTRAVRCYARAGFREAGPIVTPDGPALMMVLPREDFSARRGSGEAG